MRHKTALAAAFLVVAALPAAAHPLRPSPTDQVRTRILDGCVMASAGTLRASHPVPRCRCYARGVVRAMTPADLRRYLRTRSISDALHDKAARIFQHC
jgi:hypothetical protein